VGGKRLEARAPVAPRKEDPRRQSRDIARVRAHEEGRSAGGGAALKSTSWCTARRSRSTARTTSAPRSTRGTRTSSTAAARRAQALPRRRREGHIQFDDAYRIERIERLARVNEEIHKALIPQSEVLVYPGTGSAARCAKPREIGNQHVEPWMANLNESSTSASPSSSPTRASDVVNFLRQVTGVNIIVAPEVTAAGGGGTVTLKVRTCASRRAEWILELTSLHMAMQEQAIYISNKAVSGAIHLKMYDVTDLISPVKDFPGRELAYNAGGGGGSGIQMFTAAPADDSKGTDPQELVDFIKKNVAAKSWGRRGRHRPALGLDPVRQQTRRSTTRSSKLLANLRNQQSLQVSVKRRLLDVRKNFFEEIGVATSIRWSPATWTCCVRARATCARRHRPRLHRENDTINYQGDLHTEKAAGQPDPDGLQRLRQHRAARPVRRIVAQPVQLLQRRPDQRGLLGGRGGERRPGPAAPVITCFNGKRANAAFMNQYAYISDYDVVSSALDPKIQVLTFGNILDVLPVVSSDHKYITMESVRRPCCCRACSPRSSRPRACSRPATARSCSAPSSIRFELPNVLVRTMRSSVMIPDKGSLLIGGFEHSLRQRTHVGIPFLSTSRSSAASSAATACTTRTTALHPAQRRDHRSAPSASRCNEDPIDADGHGVGGGRPAVHEHTAGRLRALGRARACASAASPRPRPTPFPTSRCRPRRWFARPARAQAGASCRPARCASSDRAGSRRRRARRELRRIDSTAPPYTGSTPGTGQARLELRNQLVSPTRASSPTAPSCSPRPGATPRRAPTRPGDRGVVPGRRDVAERRNELVRLRSLADSYQQSARPTASSSPSGTQPALTDPRDHQASNHGARRVSRSASRA